MPRSRMARGGTTFGHPQYGVEHDRTLGKENPHAFSNNIRHSLGWGGGGERDMHSDL